MILKKLKDEMIPVAGIIADRWLGIDGCGLGLSLDSVQLSFMLPSQRLLNKKEIQPLYLFAFIFYSLN